MFSLSPGRFPLSCRDAPRSAGPRPFAAIWPVVEAELIEAHERRRLAGWADVTSSPPDDPPFPKAA